MPEDNVALLHKTYDAFGRGDIPAVMESFAEDITWHSPAVLPQGGDAKGHEGVGQFFERLAASWEDLQLEFNDFVASERPRVRDRPRPGQARRYADRLRLRSLLDRARRRVHRFHGVRGSGAGDARAVGTSVRRAMRGRRAEGCLRATVCLRSRPPILPPGRLGSSLARRARRRAESGAPGRARRPGKCLGSQPKTSNYGPR